MTNKTTNGKGIKLQETTITKVYKSDTATYIHTKTTRKPQKIYFSGIEPISMFNGDKYIDLAPKGNFITKFFKRLWNIKQLEKIFNHPTHHYDK